MINRVVLMGRLVSDPELKTTQSGINVTTFRIAVDRSYVKAGEERQADFFDIVAWRYTADFVCRHFRKGSLIAIDGSLQSRTYQAKDGTNRYVVEVIADSASFTGERRDSNGGGYNQPQAPQHPAYSEQTPSFASGSASDFEEMPADDDLPF
ncbi:MAG: single-stranded DNA-binding protein [Ruminococcus sp.]|nr:single-stranded DNA-binding protein [Ruminococcus sp.]